MEHTDPFNQLNADDQKCAIDVAIAAVLIGVRIPATGKPLYDYIATEFSASRTIPSNLAKYALRSLGRSLTHQDWTLQIEKEGEEIVTSFTPRPRPRKEADGQSS